MPQRFSCPRLQGHTLADEVGAERAPLPFRGPASAVLRSDLVYMYRSEEVCPNRTCEPEQLENLGNPTNYDPPWEQIAIFCHEVQRLF